MRQKWNAIFSALLAIFLGSGAAFSLCADAAMQDEGSNEKLLAAIPYGHNQWISAAASSWATMALILTVEAPVNLTGNGAQ